MKFYKDSNNSIYAYESDGSQDKLIPSGYVSITAQEAQSITNPALTIQQERELMAPLSAYQVRKVLTQYNLREPIEAAVAASTLEVQDAWNYAKEFERFDPILLSMAAQLDITENMLDMLFEVGVTL